MKKEKSFTLIELMVVITLMGLVATIVLVSLRRAREKARIASGMQFSSSLRAGLADALVSWWSFDDGTASDPWGDNNGTLMNGPIPVEGLIRGALSFDGTSNYVNVPNHPSLNFSDDVTIEAWVKPTGDHARIYTIVSKGERLVQGFEVMILTDRKIIWYEPGGGFAMGSIINDDTWSHVAVVRNRGERKVWIYINGQLDIDFPKSVTNKNLTTNFPLLFGTNNWIYHFFRGLIDEVRIYNRSLTALEIQKRYAEGLNKFKLVKE